eukprot:1186258-Amphidinium_carterae.1
MHTMTFFHFSCKEINFDQQSEIGSDAGEIWNRRIAIFSGPGSIRGNMLFVTTLKWNNLLQDNT